MSKALFTSRSIHAALFAAALASLSGCSMMGMGKKSVSLSLEATAQCNTCGKASAQPLEFAVLQVTDPAAITGASLVQIWGKEKSLFGDALLTRDTGSIVPSQKQPYAYERNPAGDWRRVDVSEKIRTVGQRLIREHLDAVRRVYRVPDTTDDAGIMKAAGE